SAKNSDFGIWNQPPGSNMYPNPLPIAPPNVVGPPGPFGASGYPGPPHAQFDAPGYPGPPLAQFGAHSFPVPPGQFGPVSHQSDPSAPPPYQDYQSYP
ncbi:hypothetical protein M9458_010669, partial [Cirrhinus mrigala]